MITVKTDELDEFVGKEIGVSDWITIDQDRIDKFAEVTEDHQFIHVDPEAAKATPFGTTIAPRVSLPVDAFAFRRRLLAGSRWRKNGCKLRLRQGSHVSTCEIGKACSRAV